MMELYEMGVVTNTAKAFHKGKFVATFAMGSRKLYDWLDDNVAVEFMRGKWVNNPSVVSQNSKMVSVNTCLMADLTGQVASESLGPVQYSGTGGQSDTAEGAVEGFDGKGKSIIACYSTAKNGTVSTIVPMLTEGTAVTLHRSLVDYVVTEFGIASLRGKTVRERGARAYFGCTPKFQGGTHRKSKDNRVSMIERSRVECGSFCDWAAPAFEAGAVFILPFVSEHPPRLWKFSQAQGHFQSAPFAFQRTGHRVRSPLKQSRWKAKHPSRQDIQA